MLGCKSMWDNTCVSNEDCCSGNCDNNNGQCKLGGGDQSNLILNVWRFGQINVKITMIVVQETVTIIMGNGILVFVNHRGHK